MTEHIGRAFIEWTKHHRLTRSDQSIGLPQPSLELHHDPDEPLVQLPDPERCTVREIPVREAIEARRSVRRYSSTPLTLQELSYLLWCTQGVKEVMGQRATLRTVPSAGARHALETFVLANRVSSLTPGLYRFLALEHQLAQHTTEHAIASQITVACFGQSFVKTSAVTFIWVAVPYRMNWRYGERGYRYLHLDAGHVCQNLYLSAEAIDCGVCAIAAYDDDQLNQLLGIDGEKQFAIYVGTVGKK
jgi:SagB-type dehydrogenase family enzyme